MFKLFTRQSRTSYGTSSVILGPVDRLNRRLTRRMRPVEAYVLGPTLILVITASLLANVYFLNKPEEARATTLLVITEETPFPPILEKICQAESGGRQYNAKGRVLRGTQVPSDLGYCQINETIWNDRARELGFDIYTEEGNREMALWIFLNYGTDPWNSSKATRSK